MTVKFAENFVLNKFSWPGFLVAFSSYFLGLLFLIWFFKYWFLGGAGPAEGLYSRVEEIFHPVQLLANAFWPARDSSTGRREWWFFIYHVQLLPLPFGQLETALQVEEIVIFYLPCATFATAFLSVRDSWTGRKRNSLKVFPSNFVLYLLSDDLCCFVIFHILVCWFVLGSQQCSRMVFSEQCSSLSHAGEDYGYRGQEEPDGGECGEEADAGLLEPEHLLQHQAEAPGRRRVWWWGSWCWTPGTIISSSSSHHTPCKGIVFQVTIIGLPHDRPEESHKMTFRLSLSKRLANAEKEKKFIPDWMVQS